MTDKTTKTLLLAIAIGLWANLVTTWLRPAPLEAQSPKSDVIALSEIATHTRDISVDTASMRVSLGAMALDSALKKR